MSAESAGTSSGTAARRRRPSPLTAARARSRQLRRRLVGESVAPLLALEGQTDELVQERRERKAARLPELGIHGDRRESWECVQLVDEHTVGAPLEEEVHAGHA